MSLQDPTKKMSKSDENQNASVFLFDSPEAIKKKIMSAVTDSESEIKASAVKPGITNLLGIYADFMEVRVDEAEKQFAGKSYGEFKQAVAKVVATRLKPIQEKYAEIRKDDAKLLAILQEGAQKAQEISHKKLEEVYEKVGFIT